jgi:maleamate amidohydrolase
LSLLTTAKLSSGNSPALVIVDMCNGFIDPQSPLGFSCEDLVNANIELLKIFREMQAPIFFTTTIYRDDQEASVFRQKLPDLNILSPDSHWVGFREDLSPSNSETVIEKKHASGFFMTDLADQLHRLGIDTVYISGVTTSGCVRATALDSLQHDFLTFIVQDCVGDRDNDAHQSNLRDLQLKYAELVSLAELN